MRRSPKPEYSTGLKHGFAKALKEALKRSVKSCGRNRVDLSRTRHDWNAPSVPHP